MAYRRNRASSALLTPRVQGHVLNGDDPVRIDRGVGEEVHIEIISDEVRSILARTDELKHLLERLVKRREVSRVEFQGLGFRVGDLIFLSAHRCGPHALEIDLDV